MSLVSRVPIPGVDLSFSAFAQGYWRLGQWGMDKYDLLSFIEQHLELGVTTIDHASIYGPPSCEALFGEALKLKPSLAQELEIVSKCGIVVGDQHRAWHYTAEKQSIIDSVELSLTRLGVEQLDVLLLHRPDYLLQADEVAEAFAQLKAAGKVAHFGVSNYTVAQFELLQSRLPDPLVTNQIEINPLYLGVLDSGILETLQRHKIRPMAWSCLAGGRILSEQSEVMERLRSCLLQIAEEVGARDITDVVYAWVLKLPCKPIPVIGSGNIDRVKASVSAADIKLTHEQWYRIWTASNGQRVP